MNVEVEIVKEIPRQQINQFMDKVVYNIAIMTRETTKANSSFPYRTGKLMRSEVAMPVMGSNAEYALLSGVDYAVYVWNMTNVHWTNSQTIPQWYFNIFEKSKNVLVNAAVVKAEKGL